MTGWRGPVRLAVAAVAVASLVGCTDADDGPPEAGGPSASEESVAPSPSPSGCDLDEDATTCLLWSLEDPAAVGAGPDLVAVADGGSVAALDPVAGEERWRVDAPAGEVVALQPTRDAVVVTALLDDGAETTVLAADDGSTVWVRRGAPPALVRPDDVVVGLLGGDDPDAVEVVGIADGRVRWRAPAVQPFGFVAFDRAALVDDGAGVALLDLTTGDQRWRADGVGLDAALVLHAPATLPSVVPANGRPTGTDPAEDPAGGVLLDGTTGEVLASLDDQLLPEVAGGAVFGQVGLDRVVGLDDEGGETWSIPGRALTGPDGAVALVLAEDQGREGIVRIDPGSGERLWQLQVDSDVTDLAAADDVVALLRTGSVTLHDAATGDELGVVRGTDLELLAASPLLVRDGTGRVAALDPR